MPKQKNVTDAEITACHAAAGGLLAVMQDLTDRMDKGYVDRINNPTSAAKEFALIAREAAGMASRLLAVDEMQKQKDELDALRRQVGR